MTPQSYDILATLSIIHQRHNSSQRALILGLSAMKLDDRTNPGLWLSVAESFLATGHPDKALALLERFDGKKYNFDKSLVTIALRLSSRAWLRMREPEKAKEMIARAMHH